jgi:hypothetical protein
MTTDDWLRIFAIVLALVALYFSRSATRKANAILASGPKQSSLTPHEVVQEPERKAALMQTMLSRRSSVPDDHELINITRSSDMEALLFELRGSDGHIWRLYANGIFDGFPEGTVMNNHALPLIYSLICKQQFPGPPITNN